MTPSSNTTVRWDLITCATIIVACSVLVYDTLDLPPGSFEPLGSGFMPRVIGLVIIGLSVIVALRSIRRPAMEAAGGKPDLFSGFSMAVLTIALTALFQSRAIDFGILMTAFLFISIMALERGRTAAIGPALLVALIVGFGAKYVFTRVFVVDLPVWF